ncbi:MAG: PpiC-type peptidyl-prolyl cis-trans isomerase [Chitinophagaceae bacterium]|nr:PpiC-type peptidyl-prolyl cis-trans isomerase [Chitinophagaceae bacterium]
MSIIQTIRDKGAAIVIGVIALSLIGFLLMDARSGAAKGLFGGRDNSKTLGVVNGKDIELDEFNSKVKDAEAQYPNTNGGVRQQIMQGVWDQMVAERIVAGEFEKLGLAFTPREMSVTMFSDDAPQQLKQAFTDPQTGQYDVAKAQQWWAETKRSKNEEQRLAVNSQVIDPMRLNSLYTKYTSMIAGSMYTPSWMVAKENEEDNSFANISYVAIPYAEISDSAIKVTDDDIEKYLEKNKLKYKQEAGRMISYITFSASPSAKDSAEVRNMVESLKPQFAADTNAKAFLARNTTAINFFDGYALKSKMQMPNKDSIINLSDGKVFGPYLDGGNYVLAKKLSTKILPDSIKCRHILLGTNNPQTGAVIMADSIAKQKIDSIAAAIKAGADFTALEEKYSTDEAAKKDKGVMTFDLTTIQSENFAKEFGDFLLNEPGETKKVVKTQFGWHYIEILEKKNPQPAYKVAYLAKEIIPSDETVNAANAAATKLSGQARDIKAFDEYIKKNGLSKVDVPAVVKENDAQLGGLQDARSIVKWAFDAKEGEVSEPFSVGNQFVVAVVTKKVKEGLPDVKTARPLVESLVRNNKKAEEIKKKLGNTATLETAAAAYQKQVLTTGADSTLTFNAAIINGVGNEPKVAGASFNKDYQTKVSPAIEGNTGVFVIKVNSINTKPPASDAIAQQQRTMKLNQALQSAVGKSFEALKKTADIKDKRSKFF